MELDFRWDEAANKLVRFPDTPPATREDNVRFGKLTMAVRGSDPIAAESARYELAILGYGLRDWYQPCRDVPGMVQPFWMINADRNTFTEIRNAIRHMRAATTPREMEKLRESSTDVARAVTFLRWCFRVSHVEAYNFSCCVVLLMSHSWLSELNPDGDRVAISALREQLRKQYGIEQPHVGDGYKAQAAHHCTRLDWIPQSWRDVYAKP